MQLVYIAVSAALIMGVIIVVSMIRTKSAVKKNNRYNRKHYKNKFNNNSTHVAPEWDEAMEEVTVITAEAEENEEAEIFAEEDSDEILGLKEASANTSDSPKAKNMPNHIIVLSLMAPNNKPYTGYELLQALLALGFRYGKMNIFHRHEQKSGNGNILFSLASAVEPGTFDLSKMGAFSTQGLMLFADLSQVTDPQQTFELMLQAANQLVEDLDGEVLDENRRALSKEKITQIRKQIREYEAELNQSFVG